MKLQEQIRKVLKEETNQGKYTNALEDLTEVYKNEDCVCDIKISYKPDEDTYLINVKVGNKDLDNKFNGIDFRIRNYINQLRRKINEEVYDYFPISFLVTFSDTPKCSDYRNLKESDPKVGTGKKPKDSDRRLYTDENPSDTVSVKFKTKQDIVDTLNKESFKSKSHARQSQIINLIHQRLRVALERAKDPEVKKRLRTAFEYIESKKEASKRKTEEMKEGELTERCWKGYTQKGMKTMFGKRYPNCVKKKNKSLKEYWTPKEDYSDIETVINKIIPKSFSWFKEIEIDNISYSEFSNTLTIYGELKVDEEWGAKQWREYYEYKPFPSNSGWEKEDPVRLGDIIGKGELDDLNDELELIVSSVGNYSIIDTMRLGQLKLYFV